MSALNISKRYEAIRADQEIVELGSEATISTLSAFWSLYFKIDLVPLAKLSHHPCPKAVSEADCWSESFCSHLGLGAHLL